MMSSPAHILSFICINFEGGGKQLLFASAGLMCRAVSLNLHVYIVPWATSGAVGRMSLCTCWFGMFILAH